MPIASFLTSAPSSHHHPRPLNKGLVFRPPSPTQDEAALNNRYSHGRPYPSSQYPAYTFYDPREGYTAQYSYPPRCYYPSFYPHHAHYSYGAAPAPCPRCYEFDYGNQPRLPVGFYPPPPSPVYIGSHYPPWHTTLPPNAVGDAPFYPPCNYPSLHRVPLIKHNPGEEPHEKQQAFFPAQLLPLSHHEDHGLSGNERHKAKAAFPRVHGFPLYWDGKSPYMMIEGEENRSVDDDDPSKQLDFPIYWDGRYPYFLIAPTSKGEEKQPVDDVPRSKQADYPIYWDGRSPYFMIAPTSESEEKNSVDNVCRSNQVDNKLAANPTGKEGVFPLLREDGFPLTFLPLDERTNNLPSSAEKEQGSPLRVNVFDGNSHSMAPCGVTNSTAPSDNQMQSAVCPAIRASCEKEVQSTEPSDKQKQSISPTFEKEPSTASSEKQKPSTDPSEEEKRRTASKKKEGKQETDVLPIRWKDGVPYISIPPISERKQPQTTRKGLDRNAKSDDIQHNADSHPVEPSVATKVTPVIQQHGSSVGVPMRSTNAFEKKEDPSRLQNAESGEPVVELKNMQNRENVKVGGDVKIVQSGVVGKGEAQKGYQQVGFETKSANQQQSPAGQEAPPRVKWSICFTDVQAATLIQSTYRGHLVRRTQPLKHLRVIKNVRTKGSEYSQQVLEARRDPTKRKLLSESIMALLLQLDAIQGVHPSVRDIRKLVAKELIQMQEQVDNVEEEDGMPVNESPATAENIDSMDNFNTEDSQQQAQSIHDEPVQGDGPTSRISPESPLHEGDGSQDSLKRDGDVTERGRVSTRQNQLEDNQLQAYSSHGKCTPEFASLNLLNEGQDALKQEDFVGGGEIAQHDAINECDDTLEQASEPATCTEDLDTMEEEGAKKQDNKAVREVHDDITCCSGPESAGESLAEDLKEVAIPRIGLEWEKDIAGEECSQAGNGMAVQESIECRLSSNDGNDDPPQDHWEAAVPWTGLEQEKHAGNEFFQTGNGIAVDLSMECCTSSNDGTGDPPEDLPGSGLEHGGNGNGDSHVNHEPIPKLNDDKCRGNCEPISLTGVVGQIEGAVNVSPSSKQLELDDKQVHPSQAISIDVHDSSYIGMDEDYGALCKQCMCSLDIGKSLECEGTQCFENGGEIPPPQSDLPGGGGEEERQRNSVDMDVGCYGISDAAKHGLNGENVDVVDSTVVNEEDDAHVDVVSSQASRTAPDVAELLEKCDPRASLLTDTDGIAQEGVSNLENAGVMDNTVVKEEDATETDGIAQIGGVSLDEFEHAEDRQQARAAAEKLMNWKDASDSAFPGSRACSASVGDESMDHHREVTSIHPANLRGMEEGRTCDEADDAPGCGDVPSEGEGKSRMCEQGASLQRLYEQNRKLKGIVEQLAERNHEQATSILELNGRIQHLEREHAKTIRKHERVKSCSRRRRRS